MHIFWHCTPIQLFWSEVVDCIKLVKVVNISTSIEVYLLGLVDPLALKKVIRILLTLLLFYACEIIILSWKKQVALTIMAWKALVNNALPLYIS